MVPSALAVNFTPSSTAVVSAASDAPDGVHVGPDGARALPAGPNALLVVNVYVYGASSSGRICPGPADGDRVRGAGGQRARRRERGDRVRAVERRRAGHRVAARSPSP